jgi:glycosyltransferase involved in cell wall biosynthesis
MGAAAYKPSRGPQGGWDTVTAVSDPSARAAVRPPAGAAGPLLIASFAGAAGGSEQILLDIAAGLDDPPVLLCPEGALAERARAEGLPVLVRPARTLAVRGGARTALVAGAGLAAHALDVRTAVRAVRPRAVVAWGMRSALACAAALPTVRPRPPLVFEHVDLLPAGAIATAVRAAAARADRVVVLSHAIARDLDPAGRLGDRVRVAEPGIDTDRFALAPPPQGPPTVLLLGAVVGWKRPDLALEAVALAARELPGVRLVVAGHAVGAGSAALLAALRRRAQQPDLAGRVAFPGALADPRAALAGAHCLLHCSDAEPFGLVLVEAMATGRPVVAPAAGGPLEIVDECSGRLYAPGDAQAAADALVAVLGDRAALARAGEHGRRRAVERFGLLAARRRWGAAAAPVVADGPE